MVGPWVLVVVACGGSVGVAGASGGNDGNAGIVGVSVVRPSRCSMVSVLMMSSIGWSGAGGPTSSSTRQVGMERLDAGLEGFDVIWAWVPLFRAHGCT